jgi:sulfatase maturation enzyme AslB (radical SAM superfamily)
MDTFCVLPWVGREINWNKHENHCCLLPKNYNIDQIKSDLLAGIKTPACQKCWNLEEHGFTSDRQVKNSALDFYWDRDLESIRTDAVEGNLDRILMLKLLTSYTCNATCVSCNSGASSSWAQLDHQIDSSIPLGKYKFVDLDNIKTKVNFKELKMLSLIGGEPLYEKKNFDLLEHIIELGNSNVFLSMVTNGSVELTTRQKQVLSKFKNINFSVSIDGTESVFEYLRFPLKWSDLGCNLDFFREITDNISANYTLSNLNILYHNQTTEWFDKNNIVYSVNPIYTPAWLQPRALPESIKKVLKQQLSATDYNTFIGPIHTDQDQQNFQKMLEQTKIQDIAKKIKMEDYLPELYNVLT